MVPRTGSLLEPMRVELGGATVDEAKLVGSGGARWKEGAPVRCCPVSLSVGQAWPRGWVTVTVATSRQEGEGQVLLRRGRAGRTDHMSGVCGGVHQWKPSLGAHPTTHSGRSPPSDKFESQYEDNHSHSPPSSSPPWRWPCPPGKDQIILRATNRNVTIAHTHLSLRRESYNDLSAWLKIYFYEKRGI